VNLDFSKERNAFVEEVEKFLDGHDTRNDIESAIGYGEPQAGSDAPAMVARVLGLRFVAKSTKGGAPTYEGSLALQSLPNRSL